MLAWAAVFGVESGLINYNRVFLSFPATTFSDPAFSLIACWMNF